MTKPPYPSLLQLIREAVHPCVDELASDRELLRRFTEQRDERAFADLVRRHGGMVIGVGRRVLRSHQDAEDVCQATFLLLARKASVLPWRESVVNWLYGVSYRLALHARGTARKRQDREKKAPMKSAPDVLVDIAVRELESILDEELRRLPKEYAAVLLLCCFQGRTRDEAARSLALPLVTVKSRLEEGRALLRRRLARRGVKLTTVLATESLLSNVATAAVPVALVYSTSDAACKVLAGQAIVGVVTANALGLFKMGVQSMMLSKIKVGVAALLMLGVAVTGMVSVVQNGPVQAQALTAIAAPSPPIIARTADEAPGERVTYRGRVEGPGVKPVAGAKLYLKAAYYTQGEAPSEPQLGGTTRADGTFEFAVPKSKFGDRPMHIAALAPNLGIGWVSIPDEGKPDDLSIDMVSDDMPIIGQIVDSNGKPVPNATVRVRSVAAKKTEGLGPILGRSPEFSIRPEATDRRLVEQLIRERRLTHTLPLTVVTDADGCFRLTGIGRNRLVTVQLDGPKLAQRFLHIVSAPIEPIDIVDLFPVEWPAKATRYYGANFQHIAELARPIVGIIRDKDTRQPIAGATVQCYVRRTASTSKGDPILTTTTDARGQFGFAEMPNRPGCQIDITPLENSPYLPTEVKVPDSPGNEQVTVDVDLRRGVVIEGKITDKISGKPLEGVVQYFAFESNPNRKDYEGLTTFANGPVMSGQAGPDGVFRVAAIPGPGVIAVRSRQPTYLTVDQRAEADEGAAIKIEKTYPYPISSAHDFNAFARIDIPLGTSSFGRNVALDPGWSSKGIVIWPDGMPLAGAEGFALSGNASAFQPFDPLHNSEFQVTAFAPSRPRAMFIRHLEKGWIGIVPLPRKNGDSFTVKLSPGAAVSGRLDLRWAHFFVQFRPMGKTDWVWLSPTTVQTDGDGRFRLTTLPPGYEFRISTGNREFRFGDDLIAGQTKELGEVRMKNLNP